MPPSRHSIFDKSRGVSSTFARGEVYSPELAVEQALSMLKVNGGEYSCSEVSKIMGISRSTLLRRQIESVIND
ncbi:hypothetical protein KUA25_08620 [Bacteroidales bacterium MSK.15.36]|nr:hypothetical protein [Bacteroidales bacterium MSK.15.36]